MRRIFPILCGLALVATSAAQRTPVRDSQQASTTPTVKGVLGGPRGAVFETPSQMCDPNDFRMRWPGHFAITRERST
jgi:hypothetical protein